jgi:hypothetical protein
MTATAVATDVMAREKTNTMNLGWGGKLVGLAAALSAGLWPGIASASADSPWLELHDGNSIYRTNPFTFLANQATWWVDGVNHQFTDQYFLNWGNSSTQASLELGDLSLLSLTQPSQNRFLAQFSALNGGLTLSLDSSLRGFSDGSRRSLRDETLTLVNTGTTALDFTLFSYIDFDLLDFDVPQINTFSNDTTFFQNNLLTQTDPSGTVALVAMNQTPDLVQIIEYPFLITQLKSGRRPQLTNTPGPLVNGDGSAALQFDRRLAAGESITFRFLKTIDQTSAPAPVPEPTLLLSLGVVAGGLMLLRRG